MKKIKISLSSLDGDTALNLLPAEALATMKDNVEHNGKWLFGDDKFINTSLLEEEDLKEEVQYYLINQLGGGQRGDLDIERIDYEDSDDAVSFEKLGNGKTMVSVVVPPKPTGIRPVEIVFAIEEFEGPDLEINVDSNNDRVTFNLNNDNAMQYLRGRNDIKNVLTEVFEEVIYKDIVKDYMNQTNMTDRNQWEGITSYRRPQAMKYVINMLNPKDAAIDDVTITLDSDNTLYININKDRILTVARYRKEIVNGLYTRIVDFIQSHYNGLMAATNR